MTPKHSRLPDPTTADGRRRLAEAGRFEPLLDVLTDAPAGLVDLPDAFRSLRTALQVAAAGHDPAAFSERLFGHLLAGVAYLTLRAQVFAARLVARADGQAGARGPEACAPGLTTGVVADLVLLEGHLADLLLARAATARKWDLARRRTRARRSQATRRPARDRSPVPTRG